MKEFFKKIGKQLAITSFNVYKDKKIREVRNKSADCLNNGVKKTAKISKLVVTVLLIVFGLVPVGLGLITLSTVVCVFEKPVIQSIQQRATTVDKDATKESALPDTTTDDTVANLQCAFKTAFWILLGTGLFLLIVPPGAVLAYNLHGTLRKSFADDLEKKIRGK